MVKFDRNRCCSSRQEDAAPIRLLHTRTVRPRRLVFLVLPPPSQRGWLLFLFSIVEVGSLVPICKGLASLEIHERLRDSGCRRVSNRRDTLLCSGH